MKVFSGQKYKNPLHWPEFIDEKGPHRRKGPFIDDFFHSSRKIAVPIAKLGQSSKNHRRIWTLHRGFIDDSHGLIEEFCTATVIADSRLWPGRKLSPMLGLAPETSLSRRTRPLRVQLYSRDSCVAGAGSMSLASLRTGLPHTQLSPFSTHGCASCVSKACRAIIAPDSVLW